MNKNTEPLIKIYRFDQLETLRGLLAWWVVIFHCMAFTGLLNSHSKNPIITILSQGDLAVDGFIILSGIVITNLIINKNETYSFYIKRRFFRLAPIYFAALIVSICLQKLYLTTFQNLSSITNPGIFAAKIERVYDFWNNAWQHILLHLTLLHGILPNQLLNHSATTIMTPAWSISLEWQFYITAPLLIFLIRKKLVYQVLLVVLCFVLIFIQKKASLDFEGAFFPFQIRLFLIGIYTFMIYQSKENKPVKVAILLIMITLSLLQKPSVIVPMVLALGFFFIPNMLKQGGRSHAFTHKITSIPFFKQLGKVSYSTYLFHQAVQLCILFVITTYFPITNKLYLFVACFITSSIIVYFLSLILYKYIEEKGISIGKKHMLGK